MTDREECCFAEEACKAVGKIQVCLSVKAPARERLPDNQNRKYVKWPSTVCARDLSAHETRGMKIQVQLWL